MKVIKFFSIAAIALVSLASCDIRRFEPSSDVAPFDGTIETAQHVDLGLSIEWAGYNVGATKPQDFGGYFACGEDTTRIYYSINDLLVDSVVVCKGYNQTTSKFDAAAKNWGENYKLPTQAQVTELSTKCEVTYCTYKGVRGYAVTGPSGKSIFFPCCGYKTEASTFNNDNNPTYQATYWYNTSGGVYFMKADFLKVNSSSNLFIGLPVRAVYEPK